MIDLKREGEVFVLQMDDGENRFRPECIAGWNTMLDEVEAAEGPKALVTTGTGKFYSNGLDLEWMMSEASEEERSAYLPAVMAVMARVLVFPAMTVAAMNGHAFGAGAQIALGHDYRVMREDRGFFCMPEINMGAPLHPGMTSIIMARLPHQTAHKVITEGQRWGAADALEAKIVDYSVPEADVVSKAVELAAELASKAHPAMKTLKTGMYHRTLAALAMDFKPEILEGVAPA